MLKFKQTLVYSSVILAIGFTSISSSYANNNANLDVNTPAVQSLSSSMQQRHQDLMPFYESGAIGLTKDGKVTIKDVNTVPLPQRATLNQLISAENHDRSALYREIARANNHPEWEAEIRDTFAKRFIDKAQSGWWIQTGGTWKKK